MKLHDRLPEALERIANSITVDDPGPFDPTAVAVMSESSPSRRPLIVAVAAATIAVAGVGAVAVTVNRPGTTVSSTAPAAAATPAQPANAPVPPPASSAIDPATSEPGPPGAMTPPASAGFVVDQAAQGEFSSGQSIHWYATSQPAPETTTYLRVLSLENSVPAGHRLGCVLDDARDVQLSDGSPACIATREPAAELGRIAVDRSPFAVIIDGNATDDELLIAAEHLVATGDDTGFEIAAEGVPTGLTHTGTGRNLSDFAVTGLTPQVNATSVRISWSDTNGRLLFYAATADDPALMPNLRLGYDTVSDVTVRGVPGFIRTIASQPDYLGVVWMEQGLLYQVGSQGFTQPELLDLLDQMRPATNDEWADAIAAQQASDTRSDSTAPVTTTTTLPG